ncbi:MAG: hypothetical protein M3Y08_02270 [Fibrobacterota bacterium]|nr:hypothetical protein [Fibrobacterota bacterium]
MGVRADGKRPVLSGGTNTVHFKTDAPYKNGADHYVFQGFDVTTRSSPAPGLCFAASTAWKAWRCTITSSTVPAAG